ncbi:type IV pili methyl-accepting chemotaxis transducer N-terminal domain-containing protein [Nitrosophilus alvini]|uniref:type IV pili methyl-accepting chemotaxis transducer N-terminal domain-containing protein n=1 Tax=Nitrosophilus alvini TaxID=2714855 RepID=UPI00190CFF6B|nr:type IV pili methyl-accepting chemotaxis transducer N-terminal domain-containing protein [Nitrosophilus alvini]
MRKITSQIKFIGGALSFFIIAIIFSVIYINHKSKTDSVVINVSGKQRMLTQRISKEVFRLKTANDIDTKELDQSIEIFEKNLFDLLNGNEKRGIYKPPTQEIKEQLERVKSLWLPFRQKVYEFKDLILRIYDDKRYVIEKNSEILDISDEIVKAMTRAEVSGEYIDKAGRQRMLSQRMMYFLLLYLNEGEPKYYRIFYESLNLYDKTLNEFYNDMELLGKSTEIEELVKTNINLWKVYSRKAQELMETQSNINNIVSYVHQFNTVLLEGMDQAVSMYTIYSEQQRETLENIEYILGLIALVIMFYSSFLIRRIQKDFDEFLKHSKSLVKISGDDASTYESESEKKLCEQTDELTQAATHLEKFIKKIDKMIVDAQNAIETSKKIAKEIGSVGEIIEKDIDKLNIDKDKKKKLDKYVDNTEDIAIQSLEELQNSTLLLQKLHENLVSILKHSK